MEFCIQDGYAKNVKNFDFHKNAILKSFFEKMQVLGGMQLNHNLSKDQFEKSEISKSVRPWNFIIFPNDFPLIFSP